MKVLLATLVACTALSAVPGPVFDENQNDNELLEPFLFNKREKMARKNPLGISGDVRVTGRADRNEDDTREPTKTRIVDRPYTYKAEANIFLDQTMGCWWTSIKISASNNLGAATGVYDSFRLRRALIGYKPYCCGKDEVYGELGRQCLSDKFDSEVMFASPLDGGFFHATKTVPRAGSLFLQGAFLVVDAERGQYGWVGSVGWESILCTGLFVKYALIDWGRDRAYRFLNFPEETRGFRPRYLTSQILFGYKWCWCGKEIKVFAAYLRNHDAQMIPVRLAGVRFGHERDGAYIGAEIGKVRKCGDWAIKAELQYVEAFCFPEFDNAGIGNNLGANGGLFSVNQINNNGFIVIADTRSPLNYWGPKLEFAYAFTDNVSGRVQYMQSWGIRKVFQIRRKFRRLEAKLIYSF